jgi:hypothetical protein
MSVTVLLSKISRSVFWDDTTEKLRLHKKYLDQIMQKYSKPSFIWINWGKGCRSPRLSNNPDKASKRWPSRYKKKILVVLKINKKYHYRAFKNYKNTQS